MLNHKFNAINFVTEVDYNYETSILREYREQMYNMLPDASDLVLSTHNDKYPVMVDKINKILNGLGMSGQGETLVSTGFKYNIDPYIITAIAMVESTGGTYTANSYNAWGRKSRTGWMSWNNWEESIDSQGKYLKEKYIDLGLKTLEDIGRKYCPNTYQDWANKVSMFQSKIINQSI